MFRPFPPHLRFVRRALLPWVLVVAGALVGGCAKPDELLTGSTGLQGRAAAVAPWQTRAAAAVEAVRSLSEGEGEVVVATAIAAHEMRRP